MKFRPARWPCAVTGAADRSTRYNPCGSSSSTCLRPIRRFLARIAFIIGVPRSPTFLRRGANARATTPRLVSSPARPWSPRRCVECADRLPSRVTAVHRPPYLPRGGAGHPRSSRIHALDIGSEPRLAVVGDLRLACNAPRCPCPTNSAPPRTRGSRRADGPRPMSEIRRRPHL